MAELQRRSPSTGVIILTVVLAVVVGTCMAQYAGGQDGCEASGGTPRGMECVKEEAK